MCNVVYGAEAHSTVCSAQAESTRSKAVMDCATDVDQQNVEIPNGETLNGDSKKVE